jgi:hypothetical protein
MQQGKVIESPARDRKGITIDRLAWLHGLKETDESSTCDIQSAYQQCIETNYPNPKTLVTQIIARRLINQGNSIDKHQMQEVFSNLYSDLSSFQDMLRNPDRDNNKLLREIQVQSLLRLQFLAMDKLAFLKFHHKMRRTRKRKANLHEDIIYEVISILEKASFLISVNTLLGDFLAETIPELLYRSIPEDIEKVFTFFECSNPYNRDDESSIQLIHNATKKQTAKKDTATSPPSTLTKERKLTEISLLNPKDMTKSSSRSMIPQFKEDIQLQHSVSLVSHSRRRKNPLILNAKGYYVGSHFNTRLANAEAHYRTVPANGISRNQQHDRNKNSTKSYNQIWEKEMVNLAKKPHPIGKFKELVMETPVKRSAIDGNSFTSTRNDNVPNSGRQLFRKNVTSFRENENKELLICEKVPFLPRLSTVSKGSEATVSKESEGYTSPPPSTSSQARILAQRALSASRRTIRSYDATP